MPDLGGAQSIAGTFVQQQQQELFVESKQPQVPPV
jgi:hypothetical protein